MRTRWFVDVCHGSKQINCLLVPGAFVMAAATFTLATFPQLPVFANASASASASASATKAFPFQKETIRG